jgi:hypothetical protein
MLDTNKPKRMVDHVVLLVVFKASIALSVLESTTGNAVSYITNTNCRNQMMASIRIREMIKMLNGLASMKRKRERLAGVGFLSLMKRVGVERVERVDFMEEVDLERLRVVPEDDSGIK